jgi:magnesium-transporting ATPase (P-type)
MLALSEAENHRGGQSWISPQMESYTRRDISPQMEHNPVEQSNEFGTVLLRSGKPAGITLWWDDRIWSSTSWPIKERSAMKYLLAVAKCIVVIVFVFSTYKMVLHTDKSTNVFKYVAIIAVLASLLICEVERWLRLKNISKE